MINRIWNFIFIKFTLINKYEIKHCLKFEDHDPLYIKWKLDEQILDRQIVTDSRYINRQLIWLTIYQLVDSAQQIVSR